MEGGREGEREGERGRKGEGGREGGREEGEGGREERKRKYIHPLKHILSSCTKMFPLQWRI